MIANATGTNVCTYYSCHLLIGVPYTEFQWVWSCVGDGEMCDGGGEGGAGDGDHMIWRGGVYPDLQLEPHVVGCGVTPLGTWGTQTPPGVHRIWDDIIIQCTYVRTCTTLYSNYYGATFSRRAQFAQIGSLKPFIEILFTDEGLMLFIHCIQSEDLYLRFEGNP